VSTPIVTPAASHVAASGLGEVPGQARKEQAAAEEDAAQADVLAFLSHANPGVFPTPTPVSSSAGHVEHSEHAQNFHPDDGAAAYGDDEAFGDDAAFEEELADARAVQPPPTQEVCAENEQGQGGEADQRGEQVHHQGKGEGRGTHGRTSFGEHAAGSPHRDAEEEEKARQEVGTSSARVIHVFREDEDEDEDEGRQDEESAACRGDGGALDGT
jgi:hypothetical protein